MKSGFEEDFDPTSAKGVLTARFGQFVTEKRSHSQPRSMIPRGGSSKLTNFGREKTPTRKLRILDDPAPKKHSIPSVTNSHREIPWGH